MRNHHLFIVLIGLLLSWGCSAQTTPTGEPAGFNTTDPDAEKAPMAEKTFADIVSVEAISESETYQFTVGISSPDEGCSQYADWWEVLSEDGKLLYRRILYHSHVDEQPFIRSGGPVAIKEDTQVIVRAHMNTTGYGGTIMKGSVKNGFIASPSDPGFVPDLEKVPPLPEDCAF